MSEILDVTAGVSPLWAELAGRPDASVFVSPPWLATLADTYGIDCRAVVLVDQGRPRSGMVYATVEDAAGRRTQSLPFSDYADPVLGDQDDLDELLVETLARAGGGQVRARVLHARRPPYERLMTESGGGMWHSVSICSDGETTDDLWQRLGGSARRNVRKARESGVTVRIGQAEADVDIFFDLHLGTRKHKYRLLPQPRCFFANLRKRFEPSAGFRLAIAEHDGQPIAAIALLEWNGVAYYKFNASSPAALAHRPNDLLLWETMKLAHERGNLSLDLGLSDLDQPGLLRYKRKFATAEAPITTYLAGEPPSDASLDLKQRLGALTEALTDESVPDWVVARAGDSLYRYFS